MARFSGIIGFVETVETSPSVYEDVPYEIKCSGDILENTKRWEETEGLHDDVGLGIRVSVVMKPEQMNKFFCAKYIYLYGQRWEIQKGQIKSPRVILTVGGMYNGPTPSTV